MYKKKITGKTKLKGMSLTPIKEGQETLNLVKKKKIHPTSYRFKESDIERLKEIVKAVNNVSNTKISETNILRALILIGEKMNPERIINAVKQLL